MVAKAEGIDPIFGVRLHELPSEERLRQVCERFLDGDRTFRIFTPNPEILLLAREDPSYAEVLNTADLALPDGTGIAVVESLRSRRRVRRWPGMEIGATLLELAAERGASVLFLGAGIGVAERAAVRWAERLPDLRIETVGAGIAFGQDGRATSPDIDATLIAQIRAVGPSIVMVALGAPKQERWIANHAEDLPSVRIAIGVGGTLDTWSGQLARAPSVVRRAGLEWGWRLVIEPRRLPRILRAAVVFPFRVFTERYS